MLQASNISVFRNDLSGLPLIFRENQQRRVHFSDYSTVTAVFANKENGVFLPFPLFKDDKETCETPFADLFKKKRFSTPVAVSHVSVRWFIFQPSQVFLMAPFIDKDLNMEKLHFVNSKSLMVQNNYTAIKNQGSKQTCLKSIRLLVLKILDY